ncbi:hydrogenase maturation protease [Methanovulcanius yangii]|uniref:hydrogenase maturation protease n=1 Tax=Methanovulcanius yangii TaxID=1789227 RepID=UPI0029CA2F19|nr:hydrogenase maturation protease [Methanovulcanius yangii]
MNEMKRTLVIGCGNPLMGNDAVGLRVIEALEGQRPDIATSEGGVGGLGLIPMMENHERIIIVDAMSGYAANKGEIKVFNTPPDNETFPLSLSDIGVLDTVGIAKEMGISTEIIIIGIEGGHIDHFSDIMDPDVENAVPKAVKKIEDLIDNQTS